MNEMIIAGHGPGIKAAKAFEKAWGNKKFNYGDTIPRGWLEEEMGLGADGIATPSETALFRGHWMLAVGQFKSYLLHRLKIMVVSRNNPAGYYIVPPEDQTGLAVESFVRDVAKASRRSSEIAENTNLEALTAEQKRQASDDRALLRRLQQMTSSALVAGSGRNIRPIEIE